MTSWSSTSTRSRARWSSPSRVVRGHRFLTRCGHLPDDQRQEFSCCRTCWTVDAHRRDQTTKSRRAHRSHRFRAGPVEGSPRYELGADIAQRRARNPLPSSRTVRGLRRAVAGAPARRWQSTRTGCTRAHRGPGPRAGARLPGHRPRAAITSARSSRCVCDPAPTARSCDLLKATGPILAAGPPALHESRRRAYETLITTSSAATTRISTRMPSSACASR